MNNGDGREVDSLNKLFRKLQWKLILGGFVLFLIGYIWGGVTYARQMFPLDQLKTVRTVFLGRFIHPKYEQKPRNTIFETFSPEANVVMVGDSLTERGEWSDIFPKVRLANRGIGGDRTDDILHRMKPILSVKAKTAFIMAGINDVYNGQDVDNAFHNYVEIVNALKNNNATVYIQSTIECSRSVCGKKLDKVRLLNEKLKAYAAQQRITYIDLNDVLTSKDQGLLPKYTPDGVHLLGSGYYQWSQKISPYVQQASGG